MNELKEKQIQEQIISYLNYSGYVCWRNNTGAMKQEYNGKTRLVRFGRKGMSDILGFKKGSGRILAIECKRPSRKNTVTPAQDEFIELVRMFGGIAMVACSVDEVERFLKGGV